MLKSKSKLETVIEAEINRIIVNKEKCMRIYEYVNENFGVPMVMASDYITLRNPLSEASEFILFCLQSGIETEINEKSILPEFYTEKEIDMYSKSKYQIDHLKFPLRFKMIEINRDQWVGKIKIDELMELRAAQLINYNANAQRTMQRIIKGDTEIYKIKLNQTAVNSIEQAFRENVYISTPFTLNIPAEQMDDFHYDDEKMELVINSLDHFDILDGYHRYIAACKVSDTEKDFDYTMELRIVNFYEDKAKQFIYQEDQKTKMKKVDSDSMNMNNPGNIIAERLNENPKSNLKGLISRNKGIINLGELAGLIDYLFFKDYVKSRGRIIDVTKYLTEKFNELTEYDSKYLEQKYSYKQLWCVMYGFKRFDDITMCHKIDKLCNRTEELDNKKFYSKTPKKSAMNEIDKLAKECE